MRFMNPKVAPKMSSPGSRQIGRKMDAEMVVNPTYLEYRPWLNETDADKISLPSSELHIDGLCRMTEDNISMGKSDVCLLRRKQRASQKVVVLNITVGLISLATLVVTVLMLLGKISTPSCGCVVPKDGKSIRNPPSMQQSEEKHVISLLELLQRNITDLNRIITNQSVELERLSTSLSSLKEEVTAQSESAKVMEATASQTQLQVRGIAVNLSNAKKEFDEEKSSLRKTTAKVWLNLEYLNNTCTMNLEQINDCRVVMHSEVQKLNETFSKKVDGNVEVIKGITVALNNTKQQMKVDKTKFQTAVAKIWTGFETLNLSTVIQQRQVFNLDAKLQEDVTSLNETFTEKVNSVLETIWTTLKSTTENLHKTFDARLHWALNQTKIAFNASMADLMGDVQDVNNSLNGKVFSQEILLLNLTKSRQQAEQDLLSLDSSLSNRIIEVNSLLKTFWTTLKSTTENLHKTFDEKLHWALNQTKMAFNSSMADLMGDVQNVNNSLVEKTSIQAVVLANINISQQQTQHELHRMGTSLDAKISEARTNLTKIKSNCVLQGRRMTIINNSFIAKASVQAAVLANLNISQQQTQHELHRMGTSLDGKISEARTNLTKIKSNCVLLRRRVTIMNNSFIAKINKTDSRWRESRKHIYEAISHLNGTLTLKIYSVSKLQGPRGPPGSPGPPGYNGSRGPPGPGGQSSANTSQPCRYVQKDNKIATGQDVDVFVVEPQNKRVISPYCTTNIAKTTTLRETTHSSGSRMFICLCRGVVQHTHMPRRMYCYINYYECPLVTT